MTKTKLMWCLILPLTLLLISGSVEAGKKKKKKGKPKADPYASYVWPSPPDEARIRLVDIVRGRGDLEAKGKLSKKLFGATPQSRFDNFEKPMDAAFDSQGRLFVSDWGLSAVMRFDQKEDRMDVFGTRGTMRLSEPAGIATGPNDSIFVADVGLKRVLAFDANANLISVFGEGGEFQNPADVAVSLDGTTVYVADSKAHSILIFDAASGAQTGAFGRRGVREGEFNFPSALAFGPEGSLYVVDQMNARVQVFDDAGEYQDGFGMRGTGMGQFVRPKGIAVDAIGIIYVTDAAFNNVQLFDFDFQLLTFIGGGGNDIGRFLNASGVAVHGDEFAIVDQINKRVQVFRHLESRVGE